MYVLRNCDSKYRFKINCNDQHWFYFNSYYGLWLWFPELFNCLHVYYEHHNVTVSVCEVVDFRPNNTDQDPFAHCQDSAPPDNQVFINAFIVAIAPLPANLWTIVHMDKLGRKFFLGTMVFMILQNKWLRVSM